MAEHRTKSRKADVTALGAGALGSGALIAWGLQNWEVLYWALWISAFLVVELPAVFNGKKGDTFSETWWRILRIRGGHEPLPGGGFTMIKPFPWWVSLPLHIAIVAFGTWLIGHLGFGLWGG